MKWDDLDFWQCGEWQVIEERLADILKAGGYITPLKEDLFNALDATPFDDVKVVLMGQDPYPAQDLATGLAFSIPKGVKKYPSTLLNILKEYRDDTHHPDPRTGDLSPWADRGVLLWNSIPSCGNGVSSSHAWPEWTLLTKEIVERLSVRGAVFCFLGGRAREYGRFVVDQSKNRIIETSHPSPMGKFGRLPFLGSRIFTTINVKLRELGKEPIDWRL